MTNVVFPWPPSAPSSVERVAAHDGAAVGVREQRFRAGRSSATNSESGSANGRPNRYDSGSESVSDARAGVVTQTH